MISAIGVVCGMVIIALFVALMLAYVFSSSYTYEVTEEAVRIRLWLFRRLPLGAWAIPLRNVQDVRLVDVPPWGPHSGRWRSSSKRVLLTLRRRLGRVFRHVYLTLDTPVLFVEEVRRSIGPPADRRAQGSTLAGRALVAAADAVLALCAVSWALCAARRWWPRALAPAAHGPLGLGGMLIPIVWGWMYLDLIGQSRRFSARRFYLWMLLLLLPGPSQWVYYCIHWRPRRIAPPSSSPASLLPRER